MDDGVTVAIIGLGLTAVIQVAGGAFVFGQMRSTQRALQSELREHKGLPGFRAHSDVLPPGCPLRGDE
tara:strand:- start:518 stop:721 length:204 start_codon:yes stop_codon:yes gene_type:complete